LLTSGSFIGRKSLKGFHEGYSGQDIGYIMNDHVNQGMFTTNKPDVIVLKIGTNDVNGPNGISPNNDSLHLAPQRMDALISAIRAKVPNATIVVVSILPIYNQPSNRGNVTKCIAFNAAVAQVVQGYAATGKVFFADIFGKFGPSDSPDGLHLSVAGCRKLAFELDIILMGLGFN
jgi:lysophospholipase L1-like esterase